MLRILTILLLPLALAACGAEPVWAPDAAVQRAAYRDSGPPTLTLFTVINNRSGAGGHTALMVSGSQRAIFDPAGTFQHPALPERNDVVFGMTDKAVAFYKDYHARESWRIVSQEIVVSPEIAELALQRIQANGAVAKGFCAVSTSAVLRGLPGFEGAPTGFSPLALMRYFDKIPRVTREEFRDDSPDDNDFIKAPTVL